MRKSYWSFDRLGKLRWMLPALLLVVTVGFEVIEVLTIDDAGLAGFLEPVHIIELTFFIAFCALLWVALRQLHRHIRVRENAEAEVRRRNRELGVLEKVASALAKDQDIESIFSDTLSTVVAAMSAGGGIIYRWDQARQGLSLEVQEGCCQDVDTQSLSDGDSLVDECLRAGQTLASERVTGVPDNDSSIRSLVAAVPLISAEQPIGVLTLCLDGKITGEDQALLNSLGHQIGTRLEAALLAQRSRNQTERIAALGDVVRGIVAITDPDKLMQHIWEDLQYVVSFDQGIFYRYYAESERLVPVAWKGFTEQEVAQIAARSLDRHPGWVARNKTPILAGDADADERVRYFRVTRRSASCLHVPALDGDRCLGVIGLGSKRKHAFSNDDLAVVATFADSVTVAMRNADQFHEVQMIKEQWETTFDAITDGISIHDENFRIVQANQALIDLLGKPNEEIIGQTCYELFHQCAGPVVGCPLAETLSTAQPATFEMEMDSLDGIFRVTTFPVTVGADHPVGGVHIIQDITDEARMRRQMIQMEKLSAVGEMVSGVAHELNNPLTAILGYAQLLQSRDLGPDSVEDLQRVERQARRAAKIIQNLLTFARQHEPERQLVDINDLLLRTIALKAYELRIEDIEVFTEFSPRLPLLLADPYQLQQVFLNILNNAHQAMADAHKGDKIIVASGIVERPEGRHLQISIYDNGPDIPPFALARIFDPFFTTKEVGKGTGLGLSISYGIVQEHSGRIWAESPPGQGPTIYIALPVQDIEEQWLPMTQMAEEAGETPPAATVERILIVDDEDTLRDFLATALSKNGCRVDTASNGVAAQSLLTAGDYDVIIVDIKMPGLRGDALYRWAVAECPVMAERMLFITGDMVNTETREFLEQAGRPYLAKPFTVDDLYALIRDTSLPREAQ